MNALAQWCAGFWGDHLRKRGAGCTAQTLGSLLLRNRHSASVCVKHKVPGFPLRRVFPLHKRLKTAALLLAPMSHDKFLLSWWSILSNGLTHLRWDEFSLNSFISQYTTILLWWNRHRFFFKCWFQVCIFLALREGTWLLKVKRIFQMTAMKNGRYLEHPKLNKIIKQFLYTQVQKMNF